MDPEELNRVCRLWTEYEQPEDHHFRGYLGEEGQTLDGRKSAKSDTKKQMACTHLHL